MESRKQTNVSDFLLMGLTDDPERQSPPFILFLSIYLITVPGNLLVILAVSSDSHLHKPMYFFFSNLSFSDICLSTTTIPKMLETPQHRIRASLMQAPSPRSALSCLLSVWKIFSLLL
uniref:G-protein coupled receptors family 1 profile domain-containing protein n=1 Tax=Monodon monoceros TaxID=40151 RepID=A0A8C6AFH9_MONMO